MDSIICSGLTKGRNPPSHGCYMNVQNEDKAHGQLLPSTLPYHTSPFITLLSNGLAQPTFLTNSVNLKEKPIVFSIIQENKM